MRVAFLNRGRLSHPGGDIIAIDETMAALRRQGVECEDITRYPKVLRVGMLRDYDLVHMFHVNFDWSWENYQMVRQAERKYVLTPLYYPGLFLNVTKLQVGEVLNGAEIRLPFSKAEAKEMLMLGRYAIIPNGTDVSLFRTRNYPRSGVLCVSARSEDDKGAGMVRRICEELSRPYKCVTGKSREEVAEAYSRALVFVNASDSERMSLTIGEALCSGCRVLATTGNRGNEWYPGLVTFDPTDHTQLKYILDWSMTPNNENWSYRPNEAARKLTWDWVAAQLIRVYEEAIG